MSIASNTLTSAPTQMQYLWAGLRAVLWGTFKPTTVMVALAVPGTLLWGYYTGWEGRWWWYLLLEVVGYGAIATSTLIRQRWQWGDFPTVNSPTQWAFDANGIYLKAEKDSLQFPWAALQSTYLLPDGLVIRPKAGNLFFLHQPGWKGHPAAAIWLEALRQHSLAR